MYLYACVPSTLQARRLQKFRSAQLWHRTQLFRPQGTRCQRKKFHEAKFGWAPPSALPPTHGNTIHFDAPRAAHIQYVLPPTCRRSPRPFHPILTVQPTPLTITITLQYSTSSAPVPLSGACGGNHPLATFIHWAPWLSAQRAHSLIAVAAGRWSRRSRAALALAAGRRDVPLCLCVCVCVCVWCGERNEIFCGRGRWTPPAVAGWRKHTPYPTQRVEGSPGVIQ